MKEIFNGLSAVTGFMSSMLTRLENKSNVTLKEIAIKLEKEMVNKIGIYQPAIGPYPAWPKLSERTSKRKHKKFGSDKPLLDTGKLKNSFGHYIENNKAYIGSTDSKMIKHEYGYNKIPPRPVLRPTAHQNMQKVFDKFEVMGGELVSGK